MFIHSFIQELIYCLYFLLSGIWGSCISCIYFSLLILSKPGKYFDFRNNYWSVYIYASYIFYIYYTSPLSILIGIKSLKPKKKSFNCRIFRFSQLSDRRSPRGKKEAPSLGASSITMPQKSLSMVYFMLTAAQVAGALQGDFIFGDVQSNWTVWPLSHPDNRFQEYRLASATSVGWEWKCFLSPEFCHNILLQNVVLLEILSERSHHGLLFMI